MLDLPNQPLLDKARLIGGCVRLPVRIDAVRLSEEVSRLPADVWGTPGGRVGVHDAAEALFLRGFAPAEGERPIEDRPALDRLPYARSIIETLIVAPRLRSLLARLPAATTIRPHVDRPPYFGKSLRLHVPVETQDRVHMVAAGLSYTMRPGEIWALNNSAVHAVWNAHATLSRTHMICDFLPSTALLELLLNGDCHLGERRGDVDEHLIGAQRSRAMAAG